MTKKQKELALAKIATEIEACAICRENKIGRAVPGEGSADAEVVFVGEAPGKQEAASGRPFIGRAGKVLRGLIEEIGLNAEEIFITSAVKYLPEHVTPKPEEVAHGRAHLFQQLDIIQPKIVVLLGRVACLAVLGLFVQIAKEHGKVIEKDGKLFLIAYHPAAVLYSPAARPLLVEDFQKLKKILKKCFQIMAI